MSTAEAARCRRFQLASRVMLPLAALIGLSGLAGWAFRIDALRMWWPARVPFPSLAALFFVMLPVSVWLLGEDRESVPSRRRLAGLALAATVLALSIISALEAAGVIAALPHLWGSPGLAGLAHPGWILMSAALLLREWRTAEAHSLHQWLLVVSLMVPWLGLVDHAAMPDISVTGLPLQGALGFLLLGLSALFMEPRSGPMRVFTSSSPAGTAVRLLCPVLLLAPMALMALRITGERRGLYGREGGILVELAILTLGLLATLYVLAGRLDTLDIRRRFAEDAMRASFEELKKRTADLAAANQTLQQKFDTEQKLERSLRQLSAQLLALRDDERRKLARDLHDSTGSNLTALNLELFALQNAGGHLGEEPRATLQRAIHLTEQISREIRTLSYLLHPPLLDEAGLEAAVRWFVEGFQQRSGVHTGVEAAADFPRLPADVELALFRVVQEALTNVHRHSGSPTAAIRLHSENGALRLSVADYGRGFPRDVLENAEQSGKAGVGLRGMRERIRELGGILELSCNGRCNTLSVSLPAPADERSNAAAAATSSRTV